MPYKSRKILLVKFGFSAIINAGFCNFFTSMLFHHGRQCSPMLDHNHTTSSPEYSEPLLWTVIHLLPIFLPKNKQISTIIIIGIEL